jgi:hypothetical protein
MGREVGGHGAYSLLGRYDKDKSFEDSRLVSSVRGEKSIRINTRRVACRTRRLGVGGTQLDEV